MRNFTKLFERVGKAFTPLKQTLAQIFTPAENLYHPFSLCKTERKAHQNKKKSKGNYKILDLTINFSKKICIVFIFAVYFFAYVKNSHFIAISFKSVTILKVKAINLNNLVQDNCLNFVVNYFFGYSYY